MGYFSYDFIQYCEPSLRFDPKKATDFPDFDLLLFDKSSSLMLLNRLSFSL